MQGAARASSARLRRRQHRQPDGEHRSGARAQPIRTVYRCAAVSCPRCWPSATRVDLARGRWPRLPPSDRRLRHCSALRAHLRGSLTSVFPSTTATAITTFLTGLAPAQHALTGWHMWFAEQATVGAILPFRTRVSDRPLTALGIEPEHALRPSARSFERLPVRSYAVAPGAHPRQRLQPCALQAVRSCAATARSSSCSIPR